MYISGQRLRRRLTRRGHYRLRLVSVAHCRPARSKRKLRAKMAARDPRCEKRPGRTKLKRATRIVCHYNGKLYTWILFSHFLYNCFAKELSTSMIRSS